MRHWWLGVAILSLAFLTTTGISNFAYPHGPSEYVDSEPAEYGSGMIHFYEEDLGAVDIPGWVRFWREHSLEDTMMSIVLLLAFGISLYKFFEKPASRERTDVEHEWAQWYQSFYHREGRYPTPDEYSDWHRGL